MNFAKTATAGNDYFLQFLRKPRRNIRAHIVNAQILQFSKLAQLIEYGFSGRRQDKPIAANLETRNDS